MTSAVENCSPWWPSLEIIFTLIKIMQCHFVTHIIAIFISAGVTEDVPSQETTESGQTEETYEVIIETQDGGTQSITVNDKETLEALMEEINNEGQEVANEAGKIKKMETSEGEGAREDDDGADSSKDKIVTLELDKVRLRKCKTPALIYIICRIILLYNLVYTYTCFALL